MNLTDDLLMEMRDMENKLVRFYPKKEFRLKVMHEMDQFIDAQTKKNKLSIKYILTKYAFR